ncbi:MAG: 1-acyl-sn-glycerol-3-phosphate acyltransferase [Deltaproteobacteria bacterium]|nr:1-acyl-sn-glycerol-3-phosphate acyltransferase [Deltaproteobacteria bacterium]
MTTPSPKSWKYRPYPGYDLPLQERLSSFQRRPEFLVFVLRILSAIVLRFWLRFYHRFRVEGRENLPRKGSFILVANHASHLDVLCLLSAMPLRRLHQTYPAGAADYFFSSLPRSLAAATFANALPFDRKKDSAASLEACQQVLAKPGSVLALFPEGTRAPDGKMGRFRSGIGRLAAGQEFPVVPCYLEGAGRAWPKGRRLPLPGRLLLRIGQPQHFKGTPPSRQGARDIAGDLQGAVADLAETRMGK